MAAGALIALKRLPQKLNPIIRPIMDSIKKEENFILQVSTVIQSTEKISKHKIFQILKPLDLS